MTKCLHLPLDIELHQGVRRLAMSIYPNSSQSTLPSGSRPDRTLVEIGPDMALTIVVRVWLEWGRSGMEWRPLDQTFAGTEHAWDQESLCQLLETACGSRNVWSGQLIPLLAKCGVLSLKQKGDLWGLELSREFWEENAHLDPDYQTPQKRGGHAKAAIQEKKKLECMAEQQERILQTALELPEGKERDRDTDRKSISLIMRIYRACQMGIPGTADYTIPLLDVAQDILSRYKEEHILTVEKYLYRHREDVAVVKNPTMILKDFDTIYRAAEAGQ